MKAEVLDNHALSSVEPRKLRAYLLAHQWQEQQKPGARNSVWTKVHKSEEESYELLVPGNSQSRDFSLRIHDILSTLSLVEERSQLDIFTDLKFADKDIIHFVAKHPASFQGNLPLEDAIKLHECARDALASVACSVSEHKAYYGRRPKIVSEYIQGLSLGQPSEGSYVLNIFSPLGHPHRRFQREVANQLVVALRAIVRVATEVRSENLSRHSYEIVQEGVSANLCDAILGLHESTGQRGIAISMTWSPLLDAPQNSGEAIYLQPEMMPAIEIVAKELWRTEYDSESIQGPVVKLQKDEDKTVGKITIAAMIADERKNVRVTLPLDLYNVALEAHASELEVICHGELVKEGRTFVLLEPRGLSLVRNS